MTNHLGTLARPEGVLELYPSSGSLPYFRENNVGFADESGDIRILSQDGLSELKGYADQGGTYPTMDMCASTPSQIYGVASLEIDGFCRARRMSLATGDVTCEERHETEPCKEFTRATLDRGIWWCVDEDCLTCNKLQNLRPEETVRLCNALIRFTEYVFVRNIKNDLAYTLGLGLTHQEDLLLTLHQQIYRAHVDNIYGGRYTYDPSSPNQVMWVNSVQRALIFWRYPRPLAVWLVRGLPLTQEFKDVFPYEFTGNYAQTPEEKEAESAALSRYFYDGVIESILDDEVTFYNPVWMIRKKTPGEWRLVIDLAKSGFNLRASRYPCYFPNAAYVIKKFLFFGLRYLGEADFLDCFYQMDAEDEDGQQVFILSQLMGPGKLTKITMGYINAVFFCLFIMYWIHADLRRSKCIEQSWKSNLPGMEGFDPTKHCQIWDQDSTLIVQHMDDKVSSGPSDRSKANGDSMKFSSLGNMSDAVTFGELSMRNYDPAFWKLGQGTRMRDSTCLSSATVLMSEFKKGLSVLMGTAAAQAVCFVIEVVLDLQEMGERNWRAVRGVGRTTYTRSEVLRMQDIACSTTFAVLYTMTACRPGELDEMPNKDLLLWIKRQRCASELTSWIETTIGDCKTDRTGNGFTLYLATLTRSGLAPAKWMRRLHAVNVRLGVAESQPAFTKGSNLGEAWTGASMMKSLIVPQLEAIRDAAPPMPSTSYLKSVDWSRIRARSFRRTGQGRCQGRASPGPAALGPPFLAGPRAMKDFKWPHSSDSDL